MFYVKGFWFLGNPLLFKMIQLSVLDLLLSKHSHYVYLTILCEELGAKFLLETFEDLPYLLLNQLHDPTIALQVKLLQCFFYLRLNKNKNFIGMLYI